jgi:glycosyltransferase involved in cell wall biosynthesis
MKIQFVIRKNQGTSYHRLVNPFSYYLIEEGDTIQMLEYQKDEPFIDADILVFNNCIDTPIAVLKSYQKKGMKIVIDIDDMWDIPVSHPSYATLKKYNHTERVLASIKLADIVICASMRIQDAVRQHNKNTVVIPNAFPYGQENYTHTNWTAGYKTRFLYAGGVSHLKDVELMSTAFDKIGTTAAVKNETRFLIAGYTAPMRKQFFSPMDMKLDNNNYNIVQGGTGEWDKMVSVFNRTQCAEVLPSRDLIDYIDFYDYADVSLVPLRDHSWNRLKSVLKLAEAATRNLPAICSRVPPYSDIEDVPGIYWVDNNNWLQNIKQCMQEPTERVDRGLALGEYARKNWELTEWNKVRKQVFNSLL